MGPILSLFSNNPDNHPAAPSQDVLTPPSHAPSPVGSPQREGFGTPKQIHLSIDQQHTGPTGTFIQCGNISSRIPSRILKYNSHSTIQTRLIHDKHFPFPTFIFKKKLFSEQMIQNMIVDANWFETHFDQHQLTFTHRFGSFGLILKFYIQGHPFARKMIFCENDYELDIAIHESILAFQMGEDSIGPPIHGPIYIHRRIQGQKPFSFVYITMPWFEHTLSNCTQQELDQFKPYITKLYEKMAHLQLLCDDQKVENMVYNDPISSLRLIDFGGNFCHQHVNYTPEMCVLIMKLRVFLHTLWFKYKWIYFQELYTFFRGCQLHPIHPSLWWTWKNKHRHHQWKHIPEFKNMMECPDCATHRQQMTVLLEHLRIDPKILLSYQKPSKLIRKHLRRKQISWAYLLCWKLRYFFLNHTCHFKNNSKLSLQFSKDSYEASYLQQHPLQRSLFAIHNKSGRKQFFIGNQFVRLLQTRWDKSFPDLTNPLATRENSLLQLRKS